MNNTDKNATLYLVPTPIGNLDDITIRALKVLNEVDIIACEDTRHSGILFKHHNINYKKLDSYHEHNEKEKSDYLITQILSGLSVGLVTDAGSPGISDPAYRLVKKALENNINIVALPGATAFVPALTASGLSVDAFKFVGFPPNKKGRQTFLKGIITERSTLIMYESPYRIIKLVEELITLGCENRQICIARELTKIHEEFIRGTCTEVLEIIKKHQYLKGEFAVILEGSKQN